MPVGAWDLMRCPEEGQCYSCREDMVGLLWGSYHSRPMPSRILQCNSTEGLERANNSDGPRYLVVLDYRVLQVDCNMMLVIIQASTSYPHNPVYTPRFLVFLTFCRPFYVWLLRAPSLCVYMYVCIYLRTRCVCIYT